MENIKQKRVFMIHGWGGDSENHWFPWIKNELEKRGFLVFSPQMPNTNTPKIEEWVPSISKEVGQADDQTYFIGHSLGCQAIIRYLQTLQSETRIGGAVFVAGWYDLKKEIEDEKEIAEPWVNEFRDDKKIKDIINGKAIAIFSDNDPVILQENQKSWKEKIGAKIVIEHNKRHFTEEEGVTEVLSALDALLELSK